MYIQLTSLRALATSFLDDVPFTALVLIEPTIWPEELTGPEHDSPIVTLATQAIPLRRDHWKSREDASRYLAKRIPWSMWDRRVLDIYVVSLFFLTCESLIDGDTDRNMACYAIHQMGLLGSSALQDTKRTRLPISMRPFSPSQSWRG